MRAGVLLGVTLIPLIAVTCVSHTDKRTVSVTRGHQNSLLRSRVSHEFRDFIILEGGGGWGWRGE